MLLFWVQWPCKSFRFDSRFTLMKALFHKAVLQDSHLPECQRQNQTKTKRNRWTHPHFRRARDSRNQPIHSDKRIQLSLHKTPLHRSYMDTNQKPSKCQTALSQIQKSLLSKTPAMIVLQLVIHEKCWFLPCSLNQKTLVHRTTILVESPIPVLTTWLTCRQNRSHTRPPAASRRTSVTSWRKMLLLVRDAFIISGERSDKWARHGLKSLLFELLILRSFFLQRLFFAAEIERSQQRNTTRFLQITAPRVRVPNLKTSPPAKDLYVKQRRRKLLLLIFLLLIVITAIAVGIAVGVSKFCLQLAQIMVSGTWQSMGPNTILLEMTDCSAHCLALRCPGGGQVLCLNQTWISHWKIIIFLFFADSSSEKKEEITGQYRAAFCLISELPGSSGIGRLRLCVTSGPRLVKVCLGPFVYSSV